MWNKKKEQAELNFDKSKAVLEWSSFPFMDRPKHSFLLCLMILLITYILWELAVVKWDQPLYYVLGLLIFFIGIVPYFIPTRYYFFDEGFMVQYPLVKVEKLYSEYLCFYSDKLGIMLSTFKRPRRLDAFRGQSVRFSKTAKEKEEIIKLLKEKVGKQY